MLGVLVKSHHSTAVSPRPLKEALSPCHLKHDDTVVLFGSINHDGMQESDACWQLTESVGVIKVILGVYTSVQLSTVLGDPETITQLML